jgi:hypothetical protein
MVNNKPEEMSQEKMDYNDWHPLETIPVIICPFIVQFLEFLSWLICIPFSGVYHNAREQRNTLEEDSALKFEHLYSVPCPLSSVGLRLQKAAPGSQNFSLTPCTALWIVG